MSFQPIIPFSGVAGWGFLQRTMEDQTKAFADSQQIKRDRDYFRENISSVTSAQDLVADRRLLSVALGAFGLGEDINNTFFIKKVLEDGTIDDDALSNRLADKRYSEFSRTFGFGDTGIGYTQISTFADKIISSYETKEFEKAVGDQNENLRLALGFSQDLAGILSKQSTENGFWFSVLGSPPTRRVFEQALGVPSAVATLDLDRQVEEFRSRADRVFGKSEVSEYSDPDTQEELVKRFLIRAELTSLATATSSGSIVLTLLQNAGPGNQTGLLGP